MERKTGCVKWFNSRKGYGFITAGSEDVFVHHSSIGSVGYRYLVPGEYVEFSVADVPNKQNAVMAVDVTGIDRGPLMCVTRQKQA
jgi:cold shock CspA family protein